MPHVRTASLAAAAAIAYVAGAGTVWAMVFFAGLAGYVLLAGSPLGVRVPLLADWHCSPWRR